MVAAALALQAAALLWLAGDAIAHLGDAVLPAGARVVAAGSAAEAGGDDKAAAAAKDVDLDRVAELMEELASTQDDLIASVLYEEETDEGLGEVAQAYVDACEALHECVDTASGMDAIEAAWHSLSL